MTHERTKLGRALLCQKRDLDKWIENNRFSASSSELEAAELLACELYYAAANGLTMGKAQLIEAEKLAARIASKR
jgi:hypothetical protein